MIWQNVKAFAAYYKPFKGLAAADAAAILSQAGLTVLLPMVVYRVFNDYLPRMELIGILAAAGVLLVLTLLIAAADYVSLRWGHILGARMEAQMRQDLFVHLQRLSFNYFDRTKTGHIMSRISNDLTMLAAAGHAFAPANAIEAVRRAPGVELLPDCREDALAALIDRLDGLYA